MHTRLFLRLGWRMIRLLLIGGMLLGLTPATVTRAAGPWYVAPGGNDGYPCTTPALPCATLNGAIGKALEGDTIYIASGTYTGSGEEVTRVTKGLTLSGGWNSGFTAPTGRTIIDGQEARRGITVDNVNAVIERFTVQNGWTGFQGGGITNAGVLTLNGVIIKNNFSAYGGGGFNNGGGTAVVNHSAILNNRAVLGGGILNWSNLYVNNSTISGNYAIYGGGVSEINLGINSFNSSTIVGNQAVEDGGGLQANHGVMTLRNTLLHGNIAHNSGPDCSTFGTGAMASAGYSLIGDPSGCAYTGGPGDLTNIGPAPGVFIGEPPFRPLHLGHPAVDAGDPAGCVDGLGAPLTTDQRGTSRSRDGDGNGSARCDIGAFEFNPSEPTYKSIYLPLTPRLTCPGIIRDTFDNPASGWPSAVAPSYTYEYLHTEYHMLLNDPQSWLGVHPGLIGVDYAVTVELRAYSAYAGLMFGLSDDWSQFYSFVVSPYSGAFYLERYNAGNWATLAQGIGSVMGGEINRVGIERQGSLIRAYINGQLAAAVTDATYLGTRRVGLIIMTGNDGAEVRFDNFAGGPVTCGVAGLEAADTQAEGALAGSGARIILPAH